VNGLETTMRVLLTPFAIAIVCSAVASVAGAAEKAGSTATIGTGMTSPSAAAGPTTKSPSTKGIKTLSTTGAAELTADECTRLGGEITNNSDPNCKSNQRCKTTLGNGDIRSVCVDEVAQ
jgi:hypothetical protein